MSDRDFRGATPASELLGANSSVTDLVGKTTQPELSYGGGGGFRGGGGLSIDAGAMLLPAIKQISASTDNPTIEALESKIEGALRKAGVRNVEWVGEMLFQARGIQRGVDRDHERFDANVKKGVSQGVIGPRGAEQLVALFGGGLKLSAGLGATVGEASGKAGNTQVRGGMGGGVGSSKPRGAAGKAPASTARGAVGKAKTESPKGAAGRVVVTREQARQAVDELLAKAAASTDQQRSRPFPADALDAAVDALRLASFKEPAVDTIITLAHHCGDPRIITSNEQIQAYQDKLVALVKRARAQGTITDSRAAQMTGYALERKQANPVVDKQQLDARRQARNQEHSGEFQHAQWVLDQCLALRQWLDKKYGAHYTGFGNGSVIIRLVGKLENTGGELGGEAKPLADALGLPDTAPDKVERVKTALAPAEDHLKQLRPAGADVVEHLDAQRELGFEILERTSTAVSFLPGIGKPLSLALKATNAGLRYASGDWTGQEAVAKTIGATIDTFIGKFLPAGVASGPVAAFFASATTSIAADAVSIMFKENMTPAQRRAALGTAIGAGLEKAFISALVKITGGTIKIKSSEDAHDLIDFFTNAGKALGIDQAVYRQLKEFKNAWAF